MEEQTSNNTNGKTSDIEAPPSQPSPEEDRRCWQTFLAFFRCTKAQSDAGEPVTTKNETHNSQKEKKKSTKNSDNTPKTEEETASVDDLFGKQWFGYSRKKSKKGKKTTNLDEIGEVKAVDNNILKAKIGIKQRDKRPPTAGHMKRMISSDVFDNLSPIISAEVPLLTESDIIGATITEVENKDANETTQKPSNDIQMTVTSQSSQKETEPKITSNDEDTEKSKKSSDEEAEQKETESETTLNTTVNGGSSKETIGLVATTPKAQDITSPEVKAPTLTQVKETTSPEAKDVTSPEAKATISLEAKVSTTSTEAKVSTSSEAKVTSSAEANGTTTSKEVKDSTTSTEAKVTTTSAEAKVTTTSAEAKVTTTSAEVKPSPDIKDVLSSDADRKLSTDLESNHNKLQSKDAPLVKETDKSPASDANAIPDKAPQEPNKSHSAAAAATEDKLSTAKDEKSAGEQTEQTNAKQSRAAADQKTGKADDVPQEMMQSMEKKAETLEAQEEENVKIAKPNIAKKPSLGANKTPSVSREPSTDSVDKPGKSDEGTAESQAAASEPKNPESSGQSTAEEKKRANDDDSQPAKDAQPAENKDVTAQNKDSDLLQML